MQSTEAQAPEVPVLPEDEPEVLPPVEPELDALDVPELEVLPVEPVLLAVDAVDPVLVELPPVELTVELELALWPVEAPELVDADVDEEADEDEDEDEEAEWVLPEVVELALEVEPLALDPVEPLPGEPLQPLSRPSEPARHAANRGANALLPVMVSPRSGFQNPSVRHKTGAGASAK